MRDNSEEETDHSHGDDTSGIELGRRDVIKSTLAGAAGYGLLGTASSSATAQTGQNTQKVIDFSDGSIEPYSSDTPGRIPGTYSIVDDPLDSPNGDVALRAARTDGHNPDIYYDEKVAYRPSRGDRIEFRTEYDHDHHTPRFYFGVQDEETWYQVRWDSRSNSNPLDPNSLVIQYQDGGELQAETQVDADFSARANTTLKCVIDWGTEIRIRFYEAGSDPVDPATADPFAELTYDASDDPIESGGIGFGIRGNYLIDSTAYWGPVTATPGVLDVPALSVELEHQGTTYPLPALTDGSDVESFYVNQVSSAGGGLIDPEVSGLAVYEGSGFGRSLVFGHDDASSDTGGSATVDFTDAPGTGEWRLTDSGVTDPGTVSGDVLQGDPSYSAGYVNGYFVWHDGGRYHVHWSGDGYATGESHSIGFDLETDGQFENIDRHSWNPAEDMTVTDGQITGTGQVGPGYDGFSFTLADATSLTLDLRWGADEEAVPERVPSLVHFGAERTSPESLPATISLDGIGASAGAFSSSGGEWSWDANASAGGVYDLPEGEFEMELDASFAGIDQWLALPGEGGDSIQLDDSSSVTLRTVVDDGGETDGKQLPDQRADNRLDSLPIFNGTTNVTFGELGASSWFTNGTENLFHEFFALEAGGEVVTSYDPEVTVLDEYEFTPASEVDHHAHSGEEFEATILMPLNGTEVTVTRTVELETDRDRATVSYQFRLEESRSSISPTFYEYADFDIDSRANDAAGYESEGEFAYVTDDGDDVETVLGIGGRNAPDDYFFADAPAYEQFDVDSPGSTSARASSVEDPVPVLEWDLGTLKSSNMPNAPGKTSVTREIRLGSAESIDELYNILDRRARITFEGARLGQSVENTRLVDGNGGVEREIDDPAMIIDKETVPLFELDAVRTDKAGSSTVDFAVEVLGHDGIVYERASEQIRLADVRSIASANDPVSELENVVPSFDLTGEVETIRLTVDSNDSTIAGDSTELRRTVDFPVESMDPLRVGFIRMNAGYKERDGRDYEQAYDQTVRDAKDIIEEMYPVPEVRAYRKDGSWYDADRDRSSMNEDANDAKYLLGDDLPIAASDTLDDSGSIEAFDVCVVIVPNGYFDEHTGNSWGGMHLHDEGAAAISKTNEWTIAHEIGHHFAPDDLYEEENGYELAQRDEKQTETDHPVNQDLDGDGDDDTVGVDFDHARFPNSHLYEDGDGDGVPGNYEDEPGMRSRKLQIRNGTLYRVDDAPSLMSYYWPKGEKWMDSYQYDQQVDTELDPHPSSGGATSVSGDAVDLVIKDGNTIDRVTTRTTATIYEDDGDDTTVEVLGADSSVLYERTVSATTKFTAEGHGEATLNSRVVTVPAPDEATTVRVSDGEETSSQNIVSGSLSSAIDRLPDEAFAGPASNRRRTIENKIETVGDMIDRGAFTGAAQKLQNDVRDKIEKWVVDSYDSAANQPTKDDLFALVDDMAGRIETLANSGSGSDDETGETDEEDDGPGSDGEQNGNGKGPGNGRGNGNGQGNGQ